MSEERVYKFSDLDRFAATSIAKLLIFYEYQPSTNLDKLLSSLREGIRNAIDQFPFMTGSVQIDYSGKLYIVTLPGKQLELSIRRLRSDEYKDLRSDEYKDFSSLAERSFAADDLDFAKFIPQWPTDKHPVCVLQLNIIAGGLILGFAKDHAPGDWESTNAFLTVLC
jgi:hypothetical protein